MPKMRCPNCNEKGDYKEIDGTYRDLGKDGAENAEYAAYIVNVYANNYLFNCKKCDYQESGTVKTHEERPMNYYELPSEDRRTEMRESRSNIVILRKGKKIKQIKHCSCSCHEKGPEMNVTFEY